jgi:hypothetical protein
LAVRDGLPSLSRYSRHGVQVSVPVVLFSLLLFLGDAAPEQNDLRIRIARIEAADAKPSNLQFAITLENQGDADLVVLLGGVAGRKLYPNAITLLFSDQRGHISRLRFRNPPTISGRLDPYIVGMPTQATYVLRVSLAQYSSPYLGEGRDTESKLDPGLPPGTYTIQATLEGPAANGLASDVYGNRLMNLWTGTVSSDVLQFSVAEAQQGVALKHATPAAGSGPMGPLQEPAVRSPSTFKCAVNRLDVDPDSWSWVRANIDIATWLRRAAPPSCDNLLLSVYDVHSGKNIAGYGTTRFHGRARND